MWDEGEPVIGRADHRDPEAARGKREDSGPMPGARDQRSDVPWLEVEGQQGADGRRETAAKGAGVRSEPGPRSVKALIRKNG
jgi:hypothetical protein